MFRSTISGTVWAEQDEFFEPEQDETFVANVSICVRSSGEDTLTDLFGQCISSTSTDINGRWESGLLVSGVYTITFSLGSYIPHTITHTIKQTVSVEGVSGRRSDVNELPPVNTVLMPILDPELHPDSTRIAACWDAAVDYDLSVIYRHPEENGTVHVRSWSDYEDNDPILVSGDLGQYAGGCEVARVNDNITLSTVVWIKRFSRGEPPASTAIINPKFRFHAYASVDQTGPVKVLSTASNDTEWSVFCIIGSDVLDPADRECQDFIATVTTSPQSEEA